MYTCLYEVSIEGGTCFDPLFYHFPENDNNFRNFEHTFVAAKVYKVSPVLTTGSSIIDSYFPNGKYVDMTNFGNILTADNPSGGTI